ncbi:MAG: divalent-cation tolerance protein CutA [Sciscionella sp.]
MTTVAPTRELAVKLAESAVAARLAAGGYVAGPVTSVFWHVGKFGTGEEWHTVLKTTEHQYPHLEQHLLDNHEWTNPEVTAVPLAAGTTAYLDWVRRTTS